MLTEIGMRPKMHQQNLKIFKYFYMVPKIHIEFNKLETSNMIIGVLL